MKRMQSVLRVAFLAVLLTAAPAMAGSNATNYGGDGALAVNPRTGGASLDVTLFSLEGVQPDSAASLVLSYREEDAISDADEVHTVFGLPYGWALNLSYVANRDTYQELNVDGAQTYVLDETWTTQFQAAGSSSATPVKTGLKEYNQADVQYRADAGTVTVNGITSNAVIQSLDGRARYLSANGVLLASQDRWGNQVSYTWEADQPAEHARLAGMIDSWGQAITLTYGTAPDGSAQQGAVTVTLPDGRRVGWVVQDGVLTRIFDAQGKITVLGWATSCGYQVVSNATMPTGAATRLEHQCMSVCASAPSPGTQCTGDTVSWPVVATRVDCPSGTPCAVGTADSLTLTYELGGTSSAPTGNNYTGFPYYSPYAASDPAADALMSSNDASFTYATAVVKRHADQSEAQRVERTYDFLHLEREEASYVPPPGGDAATVQTRATSHCYQVTGAAPTSGCPVPTSTDYRQLPASYQSAVTSGTCVFASSPTDSAGARVSVVTRAYDGFGELLVTRRYQGSTDGAVISAGACDRSRRLDPSGLLRAFEAYFAYDTPSTVDGQGYLELGAAAGHYGLLQAAQAFIYPDDGDATPARVTLSCGTPDASGRAVVTETFGLLATSTAPPTTSGVVPACAAPPWSTSIAPPKVQTYTYDSVGRVLSKILTWGGGGAKPPGITQRKTTFAFTTTGSAPGEQSCAQVLQKVETDDNGHTQTTRVCIANGFPLAVTDALGRTTTYVHDALGLTTQQTMANGTFSTAAYSYACPTAPDGTATCPPSSGVTSCPTDPAGRGCVVLTQHAGSDPQTGAANQSYADGISQVVVLDGLGRPAMTQDNVGASGTSYTALQQRTAAVYDDLGLTTSATEQIGTSAPLIYTSTYGYGPKYRPTQICDAWGVAHQVVRDDVAQQTLALIDGHGDTATTYDDAGHVTEQEDCPLGTSVAAGSGACPTVAAANTAAACAAAGYQTNFSVDGAGVELSRTTNDPTAPPDGPSVVSVTSAATYTADLLRVAYAHHGTTGDGSGDVSSNASWTQDLNGAQLAYVLNVNGGSATTDSVTYDGVANVTALTNPLGAPLTENRTYTATDQVATRTDTAGTVHAYYYDTLDRLARYCHATSGGGSAGETYARDPLTGSILQVTHFTNAGACSACQGGSCGDVAESSIAYTYTRFGGIATKTYAGANSATLEWAYDAYQRPTCFADAIATAAGQHCPASPTPSGWAPSANSLLTATTYWPDSDAYRRGTVQRVCRGVAQADGSVAPRCIEYDVYTPVDTTGACASVPAGTDATGAFAGLQKSETVCMGGSCQEGTGTLMTQTTTEYDTYRRPCTVTARTSLGATILATTYAYDAYGNVISETHASDLDQTTASNYTEAYAYDGLMRLVTDTRTDESGGLLVSRQYSYDARGNPTSTVETQAGGSAQPVAVRVRPWPVRRPHGRAHGVVRVRITGSAAVDLAKLDASTVRLGGVKPFRARLLQHPNRDGYRDLDLTFRARRLPVDAAPCVRGTLVDGKTEVWGCAAGASSATTTTTYVYNADGAPTQTTVTPTGGTPVVTYFSYDDFVPAEGAPATGTVQRGTGTLLGTGPRPGAAYLTTAYTYDPRDRLLSQSGPDTPTVNYTYDAASLLATTSADGETWHYFYDESADPQVTSIVADEAGLTSRELGPLRSLTNGSTGSDQLRVQPDKDVAGLYDPASNTFAPYRTDAWGAPESDPGEATLDLTQNPFQYAGEYRDPVWGGVYLRARWYAPGVPAFLSRDPVGNLNRYGYGDGNPRNRVDPSGRSWKSWNAGGARFMNDFTYLFAGAGTTERVLLGPAYIATQAIAEPKMFWQSMKTSFTSDYGAAGALMVASMVAQSALHFTPGVDSAGGSIAFIGRTFTQAVLGVGQSDVGAYSHGFRRFDKSAFYQSLELSAGDVVDIRGFASLGFRPYNLSPGEVAERLNGARTTEVYRSRLVNSYARTANDSAFTASVKAVQRQLVAQPHWLGYLTDHSYSGHDGVVIFGTGGGVFMNELTHDGVLIRAYQSRDLVLNNVAAKPNFRVSYMRVGSLEHDGMLDRVMDNANPMGMRVIDKPGLISGVVRNRVPQGMNEFSRMRRNCQMHATGVIRGLDPDP